MKRIINYFLSISLFLGILICQSTIYAEHEELNNSSNEISNLQSQEQEIYDQMVQENADIETDPIELIDENTEYQFVSSCENETYANTIVQSSDGDVYAMIEIDKVTDEITVQINESTYSLKSSVENSRDI